jgi:hypothetical protein
VLLWDWLVASVAIGALLVWDLLFLDGDGAYELEVRALAAPRGIEDGGSVYFSRCCGSCTRAGGVLRRNLLRIQEAVHA